MRDLVLKVTNLSKSFGDRKVVNNICLEINEGEVHGFLGPNGAGKTTTIKIILGLLHADQGEVWVNGYDLKENFNDAIKRVGAIVETPQFYAYLSGYQNLKLIANLHPDVDEDRILEVLKLVNLETRAVDKVKSYSLGMKQRLGLARALLNYPRLVILDEPTNGLDPQGILEMRRLIDSLAKNMGITFFISTHLLHEVEQTCDQVAILNKGEIIAKGTVRELLHREDEAIQITTVLGDLNRLIGCLQSVDFIKSIEIISDGVRVELPKDCSVQLIKLLVANDIDIKYVIPVNTSLEEVFINLIEGGEKIVQVTKE